MEGENTVRLLCTGYARNPNSGIQCELCEHWYHYSSGSVKAQAAGRENYNCGKCWTVKLRMLQEDLHNTLRQIDKLKARNRMLEEKLLLAGTGKKDTVPAKQTVAKCMVVGDSMLSNVGAERAVMMVECFPRIKTEQLQSDRREGCVWSRNCYCSRWY